MKRTCSICLSISGLFHFAYYSPGSPVWLQMVELTSLFKLNTISICFCKAGSFMFQGGRCLIQVPSIGSSSGFPDDHVPLGCTEEWTSELSTRLDPSLHSSHFAKWTIPVFYLQNVSEYFLLFYKLEKWDSKFKDQSLVTTTYSKNKMDSKVSGFQSRDLSTSLSYAQALKMIL